MPSADDVPLWLTDPGEKGWPAEAVADKGLGYRIAVPAHWGRKPEVDDLEDEVVHTYSGPSPVEWLTVRYQPVARPPVALSEWVESAVRVLGFPVLPPNRLLMNVPQILEWAHERPAPEVVERLGVDEVELYQGLAVWVPEGERRLLRLYVLLARKDGRSWNVNLAFDTASVPGMPRSEVEADDHPRAASVFWPLALEIPASKA